MIAFIDGHRDVHGVEPICEVLPIAPSTYHAHATQRIDPARCSARAQWNAVLMPLIERVFDKNFGVYGVRKVWRQLLREGHRVARCTVARLMKSLVLQGVIRRKPIRTTISDRATPCPLGHVNRQFLAPRPNALWVSDFTYVATWAGFVCVAFVIDTYARRIVGWRVSRTAHAGLYSTRWNRRCMRGGRCIKTAWSITAIVAANLASTGRRATSGWKSVRQLVCRASGRRSIEDRLQHSTPTHEPERAHPKRVCSPPQTGAYRKPSLLINEDDLGAGSQGQLAP